MKKGTLYGIGIGPGDPSLLTIKAKAVIEESDVIVAPVKSENEESTALQILCRAVDLSEKTVKPLIFLMTGGRERFMECGKSAADHIIEFLEDGKDVSVITLGDVSLYSTYMYLHDFVVAAGYHAEVIPGITSFCSCAATAGIPLTIGDEGLAIVPYTEGNGELVAKALDSFDNIVIMKAWKHIPDIFRMIESRNNVDFFALAMSNIGMDSEYVGPLDPEREYGYFTTVIIKKRVR